VRYQRQVHVLSYFYVPMPILDGKLQLLGTFYNRDLRWGILWDGGFQEPSGHRARCQLALQRHAFSLTKHLSGKCLFLKHLSYRIQNHSEAALTLVHRSAHWHLHSTCERSRSDGTERCRELQRCSLSACT
jgi:hypothetical protein